METQVTAEELADSIIDKIIDTEVQEQPNYTLAASFIKNGLIEFAKYHVQKCKEDIAENGRLSVDILNANDRSMTTIGNHIALEYTPRKGVIETVSVDKQSILDAYNLDNIK